MPLYDIVGIFARLADHNPYLHSVIFKVNQFLESLDSFWIMRSQRSRRPDKGLWSTVGVLSECIIGRMQANLEAAC